MIAKITKKIKINAYKLVKIPAIASENVEKDKKSQYKWTRYTILNGDLIWYSVNITSDQENA